MAKYRVLQGQVVVTGPDGKDVVHCKACPAGDVFESNIDMLKYNGAGGLQPKYAKLTGEGEVFSKKPEDKQQSSPSGPLDKDLMGMPMSELVKFAEEYNIDLSSLGKKDLTNDKNKEALVQAIQEGINNA